MIERIHRIAERFVGGESIFERGEWDICCVLDGCRVDTLAAERVNVDRYPSVASTSPTWVERTFADCPDGVAYVSGNPFSPRAEGDVAHLDMVPVREVAGIETVPPSDLTARAVDVWQRRDELGVDRLVVHYMQPHVPFRRRPEWFRSFDRWGSHRWEDVGRDIDRGEWFDAYHDNLRWVLDEGIDPLTTSVDASVAVTADHGNAAGQWGISGHPRGALAPAVRMVPWVELQGTAERELVADAPAAEYDDDEQLAALGYVE